jgi:hypothetical protein
MKTLRSQEMAQVPDSASEKKLVGRLGQSEGKKHLGGPSQRWENNNIMNLGELRFECGVDSSG